MERNCVYFTNLEESALNLLDMHRKYSDLICGYIEKKLSERSSKLTLRGIFDWIASQPDPCDGEVFELLSTLNDFKDFRELMVDFRNSKETIDNGLPLSNAFSCRADVVKPVSLDNATDT
ncbi:ADP-ribosylation factor-like protein 2-binding protein [Taenia crassiceps]|uniref:ADP-ribosylation factor-like protein 2-binding protein n=1 Tax=Taenia crassiceps TaxID=6207 RepID=A0ABR4PZQ8_9CEST